VIVLVSRVGRATGARAAAAALAGAGSDGDRAALLVDLDADRAKRPTPVAGAAARALEERLAAHLPGVPVAARGQICQLTVAEGEDEAWTETLAAALPLVRDSLAVIHLPPRLVQAAMACDRLSPTGALLRADLSADRALAALAVRDLIERGLEAVVLKRPLPWLVGRAALLGVLPGGAGALPDRARRLLP
jgi:hypothetical protein